MAAELHHSWPARLGRAFRCERIKASRQPAIAIYVLLVLAASVLAGWVEASKEVAPGNSSGHEVAAEDEGLFDTPVPEPGPESEASPTERNAFPVFAAAARTGFLVASILVLLFSANLLAGEAAGGTFRILLVRPITKTDVVLSKWLLVMSLVVVLSLVAAASAWIVGHLAGTYGGAGPYSAEDLADRTVICTALTPLGLLAFAALGLFLSSLFQSSAGSLTAATLTGLAAFAANLFLTEADSLLNLATYVDHYMNMLKGWVDGESSYSFTFRQIRPALLVPPAYAFAFILAARIIFGRRDIHS